MLSDNNVVIKKTINKNLISHCSLSGKTCKTPNDKKRLGKIQPRRRSGEEQLCLLLKTSQTICLGRKSVAGTELVLVLFMDLKKAFHKLSPKEKNPSKMNPGTETDSPACLLPSLHHQ